MSEEVVKSHIVENDDSEEYLCGKKVGGYWAHYLWDWATRNDYQKSTHLRTKCKRCLFIAERRIRAAKKIRSMYV